LNNHKNFFPQDRADAEAVARDKQRAIANLFEAGAHFDEAGRVYWLAETESFAPALDKALDRLESARSLLSGVVRREVALSTDPPSSEKLDKAIELGLNEGDYNNDQGTARSIVYAQRLIAGIDHLLAIREVILKAGRDASLEQLYLAISTPARHLLIEASDYMSTAIRDARVTHEVSGVVEQTWVDEGRPENKRAHLTGEPMIGSSIEG